jgi:hypothetical protein
MTIGNGGKFGDPGPGYSTINKFGLNLDIDTGSTPETMGKWWRFPFFGCWDINVN